MSDDAHWRRCERVEEPEDMGDPFPEDALEYLVDGAWVPVAEMTHEQVDAWLSDTLEARA